MREPLRARLTLGNAL
jgi:hypothetical protein